MSVETVSRLTDNDEPTLQRQLSLVLCGFLVVATVELLIHWILSKSYFAPLLYVYLLRTPNGSGVCTFLDTLLPAFLLGYWNGRVGRKAKAQRAKALILPLAAGIIGLLPLYASLVGRGVAWWWPTNATLGGLFLALQFFFAALTTGFFTLAFQRSNVA